MSLKEIFKGQGGFGLLKQYQQSGALFTAVAEFTLLGKDRKALEILRLAADFKTKKKLEKKFKDKIQAFNDIYDISLPHHQSNKVWVCWFQGIDNAPALVQKCYQLLKANLTEQEIILITSDNMADYVQFPYFIMEKWKKGQITHTHMTDLLRLELLINRGGMWIDATVLCTSKRVDIPDYYFDSELFLYQILKPGRDGQAQLISSWLMSAKTNNKILMMTRYLCYEYWKINNKIVDYFLLHYFFSIALEHNKEEWSRIVPRDNATPHILLLRLFEQYDERMWNAIKEQTPFHKLSYKFSDEQKNIEGTYYRKLLDSVVTKDLL